MKRGHWLSSLAQGKRAELTGVAGSFDGKSEEGLNKDLKSGKDEGWWWKVEWCNYSNFSRGG